MLWNRNYDFVFLSLIFWLYWSTLLILFSQPEIPRFLSDEECEHIISLAKDSGLATSIAGFDLTAYEGDLDEDMKEAGN